MANINGLGLGSSPREFLHSPCHLIGHVPKWPCVTLESMCPSDLVSPHPFSLPSLGVTPPAALLPLHPPPPLQAVLTVNETRPLLDLINNLVDDSNQEGIAALMTTQPENTFAQDILDSTEGFSLYLAAALEQENDTANVTLVADNIGMSLWTLSQR